MYVSGGMTYDLPQHAVALLQQQQRIAFMHGAWACCVAEAAGGAADASLVRQG
jgi:hypothetical protein